MTPGSGRARDPRRGERGRPTTLAPRVRPPEAQGRLLPAAAAAPCGTGDVRGQPRLPGAPSYRVGIRGGAVGAGTRGARGTADGGLADNAARAEPRCASGAGRRARGRVCYVCACQSTLTDRGPLVRPRPRHRPLPLPIGRFEHKGSGSPRPPRGPNGRGKARQESCVGGAREWVTPGRWRTRMEPASGGSTWPDFALDSRSGCSKHLSPVLVLPHAPHPTRGLLGPSSRQDDSTGPGCQDLKGVRSAEERRCFSTKGFCRRGL
ncbi:uncharacterized protein LOC116760509 [Phocoena sinus]|uniref:uncharacterized protein LOC116760509 n=1 Tax=Phocoena sinus TaxID=42100 RepID=UPI0013C47B2E|nr:uncharacterized protein LOC116760509 [Phocoena sinus]